MHSCNGQVYIGVLMIYRYLRDYLAENGDDGRSQEETDQPRREFRHDDR